MSSSSPEGMLGFETMKNDSRPAAGPKSCTRPFTCFLTFPKFGRLERYGRLVFKVIRGLGRGLRLCGNGGKRT